MCRATPRFTISITKTLASLVADVQPVAGPSAVMSWLIAGGTCLLSAYSYMELSARIPTRGSCYIFCYATLGELAAVIGGVCLTLEYGISGGEKNVWGPGTFVVAYSHY